MLERMSLSGVTLIEIMYQNGKKISRASAAVKAHHTVFGMTASLFLKSKTPSFSHF